MRVLNRVPVAVARGPGDREQRGVRLHVKHRRLVGGREGHLDPLDRGRGTGAEVLLEKLVDRAAERQLKQAGEPPGREPGVLKAEWAAVGEPEPEQVDRELAWPHPQRLGGVVIWLGQPGAEHVGARGHALAAQQRRYPLNPGRHIALDLAPADVRAATAPGHPADQVAVFQDGQRLAEQRPADSELRR